MFINESAQRKEKRIRNIPYFLFFSNNIHFGLAVGAQVCMRMTGGASSMTHENAGEK
jgi:hypothetical protein